MKQTIKEYYQTMNEDINKVCDTGEMTPEQFKDKNGCTFVYAQMMR